LYRRYPTKEAPSFSANCAGPRCSSRSCRGGGALAGPGEGIPGKAMAGFVQGSVSASRARRSLLGAWAGQGSDRHEGRLQRRQTGSARPTPKTCSRLARARAPRRAGRPSEATPQKRRTSNEWIELFNGGRPRPRHPRPKNALLEDGRSNGSGRRGPTAVPGLPGWQAYIRARWMVGRRAGAIEWPVC